MVVFFSSSPGRFSVKARVTITSRLEEPEQYLAVYTTMTVLESLRITNLEEEAKAGVQLLALESS